MAIHIRTFAGELPKVSPRLLPDANGQFALNARLTSGELDPIRLGTVQHTATADVGAFYRNGADWLTFDDHTTRVVPGPVATDRLYVTATLSPPKMIVGATTYPLALPAPVTAPVLERTGALVEDTKELVLYCYTWVTSFGEESQPSPPAGIFWSPSNGVNLTQMPAAPTGRGILYKRIYRSVTTVSGESEFFLVAEIAAGAAAYFHVVEAAPVQEAIPSTDYDPAPGDLRGLVAMPNGMMAAYSGKEVLFCEPYKPHAWPAKYRLAVTDTIVALAAFGSSLAILTDGTPWIAQGLHPEQMAMERSEMPFPCLSARGVVDMGYAAIYPSTDGLVEVSAGGARLLSAAMWTRPQWQALGPTGFRAAQFNGLYVFSHPTATPGVRRVGMVDTRGTAPFLARSDIHTEGLASDLATGQLFYLEANKRTIREFDPAELAAGRASLTWRSKEYYSGRPLSYGAAYVEASVVVAGSVVRVFGDGQLIHVIKHSEFNRMERLPAGRWNSIEIEAAGQSTINRISVGQIPDEVMQ